MIRNEDKAKVPEGFPEVRARVTLYSTGKRQGLYYDAREVWKWFKEGTSP